MQKSKTKKPLWVKLLIVLGSVVGFFILLYAGVCCYFFLPVASFYRNAERTFSIPDSNGGFVAQGIAYADGDFYLTGYSSKKAPSPVYVVDASTGKLKKSVALKNADGSDCHSHAGGISVYGNYVYIAGGADHCLFVFDRTEITEGNGTATCIGSVSLQTGEDDYIRPSCTTVADGKIYVAEFYRAGNYPTQDGHKFTTPSGDYNQALIVAFNLSDAHEFGVDPVPTLAYSAPDQVQGLAVQNGKMYLSTSYGVAFSHLFTHELDKSAQMEDITLLGRQTPLYALDSASLIQDVKLPPMSEEIEIVDGKMYIMCESASDKYIFGKLLFAFRCYAYIL